MQYTDVSATALNDIINFLFFFFNIDLELLTHEQKNGIKNHCCAIIANAVMELSEIIITCSLRFY